jgi:hypothetical protein
MSITAVAWFDTIANVRDAACSTGPALHVCDEKTVESVLAATAREAAALLLL